MFVFTNTYIYSDRFLHKIEIPFLVLIAKDDPITEYRHVPRDVLIENANCILVEAKHGGHCDYFHTSTETKPNQSFL